MLDATAETPKGVAWLADYRLERLERLERENAWLRAEIQRNYQILARFCVADMQRQERQVERLVRVLQETAP